MDESESYENNDFMPYPGIEDLKYYEDIYSKKEFNDSRVTKDYYKKDIKDICGGDKSLQPHQEFVRNYISMYTPYNGVLLFHGVGTGKTCAAISIAEGLKQNLLRDGKKVYIITPVDKTFKNEIYNFTKEAEEKTDGVEPGTYQCTGDAYFIPYEEGKSNEQRKHMIEKNAHGKNSIYQFFGLGTSFANEIAKWKYNGIDPYERMSNSLIIIDEVHNIVGDTTIKNTTFKGYDEIYVAGNPKPIVVKAGPAAIKILNEQLVNNKDSIIQVTIVTDKETFDIDILLDDRIDTVKKRIKYAKKYNDDNIGLYSSQAELYEDYNFVRDYIPKLEKDNYTINMTISKLLYTIYDLAKKTEGLKIVLLTATPMKDDPPELARLLNILRINDGKAPIEINKFYNEDTKTFDKKNEAYLCEMARGYVSYLRGHYPINFPMAYESDPEIPNKILYRPRKPFDMLGTPIPENEQINPPESMIKLVKCVMNEKIQYELFRRLVNNKPAKITKSGKAQSQGFKKLATQEVELGNICFPSYEKIADPTKLRDAFNLMFKKTEKTKKITKKSEETEKTVSATDQYKYVYSNPNAINFLMEEYISPWAIKYKKILENMRLSDGKGISYIYCNYKEYGAFPMAFVLELNGYVRYTPEDRKKDETVRRKKEKMILRNNGKYDDTTYKAFLDPNSYYIPDKDRKYTCCRCVRDFKEHDQKTYECPINAKPDWCQERCTFKQATYMLVYPEVSNARREDELKIVTSDENKHGELIKVIIGSKASGEGISFFNVRQVHVLDPWDNYTRLYQAIGRAVRHCSHMGLPPEDRNVYVYKYCTTAPEGKEAVKKFGKETQYETADEMKYRRTMKKDLVIKKIERVLKEIAIDCSLFKPLNIWPQYDETSKTGYKGEKDYSRLCDYQKCEYNCKWDCKDEDYMFDSNKKYPINTDTYNLYFSEIKIDIAVRIIQNLFRENWSLTSDKIIKLVKNKNPSLDTGIISMALQKLLGNPPSILPKEILDVYHRPGYLIYKNKYYIWQPKLIRDEQAPIYYRKTHLKLKPHEISLKPMLAKETVIIRPKPVIDEKKLSNAIEEDLINYGNTPDTNKKEHIYTRIDFDYKMDRYAAEEIEFMYEYVKTNDIYENDDIKDGFIGMFEDYLNHRDMLLYDMKNNIVGHFIYRCREYVNNKFNDSNGKQIKDHLENMKERNKNKIDQILVSKKTKNKVEEEEKEEEKVVDAAFYGFFTADQQFKIADVGIQKKEVKRGGNASEKTLQTGQACSSRQIPQLAEYLNILAKIPKVQKSYYIELINKNYVYKAHMCDLIEKILRYLDHTRYEIVKHIYKPINNNLRRWMVYPYEHNYIDAGETEHKISYVYRPEKPKDFITGCYNPDKIDLSDIKTKQDKRQISNKHNEMVNEYVKCTIGIYTNAVKKYHKDYASVASIPPINITRTEHILKQVMEGTKKTTKTYMDVNPIGSAFKILEESTVAKKIKKTFK